MASEVGVVDVPDEDVEAKGRLMPGNIFLVDFEAKRVVRDEEVRRSVSPLPRIRITSFWNLIGDLVQLMLWCGRIALCNTSAFASAFLEKYLNIQGRLHKPRNAWPSTDQSCVHRQMKERYTTLRPYGEWLAEQTFGLTNAVASVSPDLLASPVASPRALGHVNPQACPLQY